MRTVVKFFIMYLAKSSLNKTSIVPSSKNSYVLFDVGRILICGKNIIA